MPKQPDDPFGRIARATNTTAGGAPAEPPMPLGEPVSPLPLDAPARLANHSTHGKPSAWWTYRNAAGEELGYVARFDKSDGSKVVLPLTLWKIEGRLRWVWKAFPGPRLLYGLLELAERPSATVLLVEGEKTAEAAAERLPEFAVVTWPGGSKAAGKVDWSPLAGRDVVIWPDADAAGKKAAADVARQLARAGAATVAQVRIPDHFPEGWDLADPWPPFFGQAQALAAIEAARAEAAPAGVEWPFGFRMDTDGLWYDQLHKDGSIAPQRLAAPFEVVAEARDNAGEGWAVVIRFKDRDGREKTIPVHRARLASGGADVRADLAGAGLIVSPARGKADKFSIALAEVKCARRMTLASATGWAGSRFIIPGREAIGGGEPILFTGDAASLHYGQKGSLSGWRAGVASKAPGNDLLTFALSLAFLGPLLRLLEVEGGGVHFRGPSSCGKTTLAQAAGSVWGGGGPLGFAQTWRTTANALEMIAWGHNDGLAVFDELALVAPEEAGAAAYSLASGQSKARSRADGSLRRRSEWRVAILSTGEIGLADHIRASRRGDRPMTGQELRLLDIAADAGARMGVWAELHGALGPAELSDAVRQASERDYGHSGPAFVERLAAERAACVLKAKMHLAQFIEDAAEPRDSGQAQRAAVRFGAIAAAGELAAAFGIVPWPAGWASDAASRLYRRWATAFGRNAPREELELLRQLRGVLESERSSFVPIGPDADAEGTVADEGRDGEARALKTHGWRHVRGGEVHYWFHKQGWAQAVKGSNPQDAARIVREAGFLEKSGEKDRLTKSVRIGGEHHRVYSVLGSILAADLGD
jgi:hypothetical protein